MQNKIKSKFKSNAISILLTLCVSMMCFIGMSMVQHAAATVGDAHATGHQTWENLPAELPVNTVNYYKVEALTTDTATPAAAVETKYLKVVKSGTGALTVYDADSLAGAKATSPAPSLSANFTATVSQGSGIYSDEEGWTIDRKPDSASNPPTYNNNRYSKILSVSPLSTTIPVTKTWDAQDTNGYVNVAEGTIVHFDLDTVPAGASPIQSFWVYRDANGLKVSTDQPTSAADFWSLKTSQAVIDGHSINARLVAKTASAPETWEITITGYDRLAYDSSTGNPQGLIEYQVKEVDIDSSQTWVKQSEGLEHTFNGATDPGTSSSKTFTYTLKLQPSSGAEVDLLTIEKTMEADASGVQTVTEIVVNGVVANGITYTTIQGANDSSTHQDPDEDTTTTPHTVLNRITFTLSSAQPASDINVEDMQTATGVTVNFNIGQNNGAATLILKLTAAGKLYYQFAGLPASVYSPYPESTSGSSNEKQVNSYRVVVTNT